MKKKFSNPEMRIKAFNKENLITLSGTNKELVSDALDKRISGVSGSAKTKVSSYELDWN